MAAAKPAGWVTAFATGPSLGWPVLHVVQVSGPARITWKVRLMTTAQEAPAEPTLGHAHFESRIGHALAYSHFGADFDGWWWRQHACVAAVPRACENTQQPKP
jgi:hypothetical protein